MKPKQWSSLLLVLGLVAAVSNARADDRDPLLIDAIAEPSSWNPGQAGLLRFKLSLPEKFHAYADKFSLDVLEPDGFSKGEIKVQPTFEFNDKFSKKRRMGFQGKGELTIPIEAPAHWVGSPSKELIVQLAYQACSETFCLFPVHRTIHIPATFIGGANAVTTTAAPVVEKTDWLSVAHLQSLLGDNKLLALFFVFLAGILTSFTPCIFPMIPITLAVIGHGSETRSRAQNFLLSCFYVGGIAFTYSLLGVLAASSGAVFGASLGNPWILSVICGLFLIMAFSMYGYFELQVPAFLRNSLGVAKTNTGYVGAFASGLIAGVVASPCVGPILVGILAWVATTGSKFWGFFFLFSYALGLGMIFLVLGAFTELTRKLPRSGPWLNGTKFVLGTLMLGAFYYYLSLLIPDRGFEAVLGIGMMALGILSGAFKPLQKKTAASKIIKGFLQAIFLIGVVHMGIAIFDVKLPMHSPAEEIQIQNALPWEKYSDAAIAKAKADGKPVIIDFWAEWCAACHELENQTFTDSQIQVEAKKFALLKFDATQDTEELRQLKAKWKIQGLPTVLIINAKGEWLESQTLTEFEKADKFLQRMQRAQ